MTASNPITCVVCFEEVTTEEIKLECGHNEFHKECLLNHFKQECVLCRASHPHPVKGVAPREEEGFDFPPEEESDVIRPPMTFNLYERMLMTMIVDLSPYIRRPIRRLGIVERVEQSLDENFLRQIVRDDAAVDVDGDVIRELFRNGRTVFTTTYHDSILVDEDLAPPDFGRYEYEEQDREFINSVVAMGDDAPQEAIYAMRVAERRMELGRSDITTLEGFDEEGDPL